MKCKQSPFPQTGDQNASHDPFNTTIRLGAGQKHKIKPRSVQPQGHSKNKQLRTIALEQLAVKPPGWFQSIFLLPNLHPWFKCCKQYKMIVQLAWRFLNLISEISQKKKRICKSN